MNLAVATPIYAWHGRHHVAQIDSLMERMSWENGYHAFRKSFAKAGSFFLFLELQLIE
jgi:hypothetical protein